MSQIQRENDYLLVNGNGSQTTYDASNKATKNSRKVDQSPLLVRQLSQHMGAHPDGPPHSLVGIVLILLGSFAFSCMFLFVKLMQGKANTFVLSFYRGLVEIPIALYLCARASEHPLGPSSKRNWLLVRGGVGGAAVLCFFFAIQHLPLPDAVTLQFTTPPFAAAFAVFFVGERWMLLDMAGAVICLLGVMLIAHPSWLFGAPPEENNGEAPSSSTDQNLIAIAVALLGAAFAGLAYTSVRKIGHDASANVMVLYYSCLSLPLTILGSRGFDQDWNVWGGGSSFSALDWCWILFTGVFAYLGQYLINLGLQYETAATGTLATCSQIVFTYVFEIAFLHEGINLWSVVGTLLIVGFMVVVGICKMKEADETIHEAVAGETEELALLFSAERDVRQAS